MHPAKVTVHAAFDDQSAAWYVTESSLFGLALEGESVDELMSKLPGAVLDLVELNEGGSREEIEIELIAHHRSRVRVDAAA